MLGVKGLEREGDEKMEKETQNEQQLVCFLARFQVCMAVIIAIFTSTRKRLNSEHHASLPQLEGCHLFLPQLEGCPFGPS
ncbi:hypothetical protein NC653_014720 [Populus alba x Populus x berolinensis]|uniref:Uncharacterized protein n=1 Tax=Populus alba x Populus x berolinensis TaxID=444605 RepID=A0AAD6QY00_9ROSI|nr:hypothetical protein NC653_014720 [Populus alba x Populus x berolinensis]